MESGCARGSYLAEIQRVVDDTVLYNLMGLAAGGPPEVRAVAALKITQMKSRFALGAQALKDESQLAHFRFGISEIERYQADPLKFSLPEPVAAPPGAPIGMGETPAPWIFWYWEGPEDAPRLESLIRR